MSIGIDFILRASSTGFTQGVAAANNSLKGLKKELHEWGGGKLGHAIGIFGVVEGFKMTVEHARKAREEAEKLGHTVDSGTKSVAEFGDAVGHISDGFMNAAVKGLSFFTKIGDAARHFFQDVTQEQEDAAKKMVDETGKAADEAEKRLKKSKEDNSPEKQTEAQEKLDKVKVQSDVKGTDAQKKLVNLMNERADLEKQLEGTGKATVKHKELEAAILKNQMDIKEATAGVDKEAEEKRQKAQEEDSKRNREDNEDVIAAVDMEKEKRKEVREKFAPSVEQLANMSAGGFASQKDPIIVAKQIMEKEKFASEAGGRGDIRGAMKLGLEAKKMRDSLNDVAGTGSALNAQTAEQAVKSALEETNGKLESTNKELEGVRKQLEGMLKAQK